MATICQNIYDVAQVWVWRFFETSLFKVDSCGGGAVVYWIEPLTLDQSVASSNPDMECTAHFCARRFIHNAALNPGVVNGYPVGIYSLKCFERPNADWLKPEYWYYNAQ